MMRHFLYGIAFVAVLAMTWIVAESLFGPPTIYNVKLYSADGKVMREWVCINVFATQSGYRLYPLDGGSLQISGTVAVEEKGRVKLAR